MAIEIPKDAYPIWDAQHPLANFAPVTVSVQKGRRKFSTSEQLYQYCKVSPAHSKLRDEIQMAMSPGMSKLFIDANKDKIRGDWEEIRERVMRGVIRLKVRQTPSLQEELLSTEGRFIYEDADKFARTNPTEAEIIEYRRWGIYQGEGTNLIGAILMDLREELLVNGRL